MKKAGSLLLKTEKDVEKYLKEGEYIQIINCEQAASCDGRVCKAANIGKGIQLFHMDCRNPFSESRKARTISIQGKENYRRRSKRHTCS